MSQENSVCRECGGQYHACSSCDNYGEDWRYAYCSAGCAEAAKIEWARQAAAKLGVTPEQVSELADEAIYADWSPY